MIPKIIHYCWISDDEKPQKIKDCMSSWKEILPDYKFVNWNKQKWESENIHCKWLDDAYGWRRYAFCADFLRIYSVYKYGGFYFDCDVKVFKPLDELCNLKYYLSLESIENRGYRYPEKYASHNYHYPEAAMFGSEPNNQLFEPVLDWYYSQPSYHMHGIPTIMKDSWLDKYEVKFDYRDIDEAYKAQQDISSVVFMDQNHFSYDKIPNDTCFYKHMFTNTWC